MNIFNQTKEELEQYFLNIGEKKFKATQAFTWLYEKKEYDFLNWTNFKLDTRKKLKEDFTTDFIIIKKRLDDNLTHKYLFSLLDGNLIEAVIMRHDYGISLCVSSEVGCNMACAFCESGRLKKVRNLQTYEMVEQIITIEKDLNIRISSIVIMGIGEPLDNYDNVINFIKIINDDKGLKIGSRHITLSTCGIIPKIYELMNLPLQINLAISLHAPTNSLRDKLMPINKVYNIDSLIKCIKDYLQIKGRRITIEYIMLSGVNDNLECAKELVNLFKNLNIYINLIPYNEVANFNFKRSNKQSIDKFYNYLKENNINVTLRREFGRNIDAACGQLRGRENACNRFI